MARPFTKLSDSFKILRDNVNTISYNVGDPEWNGLDHYRGLDAGKNLKFISGWYNGGNGIDKFGFCALPGGYLTPSVGFEFIFKNAFFWTSTESLNTFARQRGLLCSSSGVRSEIISKVTGLSVRCIKD